MVDQLPFKETVEGSSPSGPTKCCSSCGVEKPISSFRRKKRNKDGASAKCVICTRLRDKEYYLKHRNKVNAGIRKIRVKNKERIKTVKAARGCNGCGETDPVCLDFHHVSGDKDYPIAQMATSGYSWTKIASEIEKCEVLCANCHRREHAGTLVRKRKA